MLGKDVWGWRTLAVFFVALLIPTVLNLDSLEEEWRLSIFPEDSEPNTGGDSDFEEPESEPLSTESDDGSEAESDTMHVESADDDSEPPATKEMDEPSNEPDVGLEYSSTPDWILPATQIIALTLMAIMAVGLLSSTAFAVVASEAARVGILLAILGPLIAVTQRGERGIFTRGRILGYIEANPAIHFSAIRDALELGNGVTAHHLQVLENEGRIISWIDKKVRRFATSGIDQSRLADLQNPITGMQIAILQVLADSGNLGIKSSELRTKLETSRQLLSYHMKQLSERDLVKSEGKGRAIRWSLLEEGKRQLQLSAHLSET